MVSSLGDVAVGTPRVVLRDSGISPGVTFVLKWKARCGCWGQNTLTYVIMLFHEPGQTLTAASETDFLMVESLMLTTSADVYSALAMSEFCLGYLFKPSKNDPN